MTLLTQQEELFLKNTSHNLMSNLQNQMIMFLVRLLLELLVAQQVKFNIGKQALVF